MARKVPYKVVFHIKNNLDKTDKELGKDLDLPSSTIQGIRNRKGLKKQNDGRFKPGQKPIYVNTKANSGSFKKGNVPPIKYPDGITIQTNHGKQYKWIRMGGGRRELLHKHVWEKSNGPIQKGLIIGFKDKNTLNCDISNLYLKSRAEHLHENTNRQKASDSLRKTWKRVKLFEANGIGHSYGFKSKRDSSPVKSINTEVNKHISFR